MRFLAKITSSCIWVAIPLLIELFYIGMSVVLTDGLSGGRSDGWCTVTWLPNSLGWVDYFISLARESSAINIKLKCDWWRNTIDENLYKEVIIPTNWFFRISQKTESNNYFSIHYLPCPKGFPWGWYIILKSQKDKQTLARKWSLLEIMHCLHNLQICQLSSSR